MTPLALTKIKPPDGATCISCKVGHQMATLALVPNLATKWHHCISYKIAHQVELLALPHCHIATLTPSLPQAGSWLNNSHPSPWHPSPCLGIRHCNQVPSGPASVRYVKKKEHKKCSSETFDSSL